MRIFIMHVGAPGNIDINWTVTRSRSIEDVWHGLPDNAPERPFFSKKSMLNKTF